MVYAEYICLGFCLLHLLYSLYQSFRFKKRVTGICEQCLTPKVDGEEHVCDLTGEQIKALTAFILSLREVK